MKTRILLFVIFAVSLFSLGLLLTVLFNSPPKGSNTLLLFYGSFALTITGLAFYAQYITSTITGRIQGSYWKTILDHLRIAIIVSGTVTIMTLLQANRLLNAATALILIFAAVVAELMLKRRSTIKL